MQRQEKMPTRTGQALSAVMEQEKQMTGVFAYWSLRAVIGSPSPKPFAHTKPRGTQHGMPQMGQSITKSTTSWHHVVSNQVWTKLKQEPTLEPT